MSLLIFIDTNVILDFYRMEGGDAAKRQLKFIDDNHGRIITGNQVQMEFMKHRQKVIIETVTKIKPPDGGMRQMPPVLVDAKPAKKISSHIRGIEDQQKKIRSRIERMLLNPTTNDAVYQCVQRLFKNDSPLNLSREKAERFRIRALARKRFCMGYPPRKDGDTSIGDAINWEWIVHCATEERADVLVVSRDGDYGPRYGKKTYINDWLAEEFKARVSRKGKIELTNKLTDAMGRLHVPVPERDKEEERKLLLSDDSHRASLIQRAFAQIEKNLKRDNSDWSNITKFLGEPPSSTDTDPKV